MTQPGFPAFPVVAGEQGVPTVHSSSITAVPAALILRAIAFVIDFNGYDGGNEFMVLAGVLAIFAIPLASAILFVPGVISATAAIRFSLALAGGDEPFFGPSVISILAPIVWIVMLVPMLRGDRRGWPDMAAGTRVLTAASVRSV